MLQYQRGGRGRRGFNRGCVCVGLETAPAPGTRRHVHVVLHAVLPRVEAKQIQLRGQIGQRHALGTQSRHAVEIDVSSSFFHHIFLSYRAFTHSLTHSLTRFVAHECDCLMIEYPVRYSSEFNGSSLVAHELNVVVVVVVGFAARE